MKGGRLGGQTAITDEMKSAVEVESESYGGVVEKSRVRLFAEAIGHANPLHTNEVNARKMREGGRSGRATCLHTSDRLWKSSRYGV